MLNLNVIPKHLLEVIADDMPDQQNGPEQIAMLSITEALDHYLRQLSMFGYTRPILQTVETLQAAAGQRDAQPLPENARVLQAAVDIAFELGYYNRVLSRESSRANAQAIIQTARQFERDNATAIADGAKDYAPEIKKFITELLVRSFPIPAIPF
jgi:hypothetical protein